MATNPVVPPPALTAPTAKCDQLREGVQSGGEGEGEEEKGKLMWNFIEGLAEAYVVVPDPVPYRKAMASCPERSPLSPVATQKTTVGEVLIVGTHLRLAWQPVRLPKVKRVVPELCRISIVSPVGGVVLLLIQSWAVLLSMRAPGR